MPDWLNAELAKVHIAEQIEQAAYDRLLREAKPGAPSARRPIAAFLFAVGGVLLAVGSHLKRQYDTEMRGTGRVIARPPSPWQTRNAGN